MYRIKTGSTHLNLITAESYEAFDADATLKFQYIKERETRMTTSISSEAQKFMDRQSDKLKYQENF